LRIEIIHILQNFGGPKEIFLEKFGNVTYQDVAGEEELLLVKRQKNDKKAVVSCWNSLAF